jgi:hypothetical protein
MTKASSSGHQRTVHVEKPSRMRVINGSSALKPANTLAKVGRTNRLITTSAIAIAAITMIG